MFNNGNFTLLLTWSGQEWQFHTASWYLVVKNGNFTFATDIKWSRIAISHWYWQLKWSRMESSHWYCHLVVKNGNITLLLTSSGEAMAISHYYWHLGVKYDKFTLILKSSGHRMAIWLCYWHLVIYNGNFRLLLTTSGQEWQFPIATDIKWSSMTISHCY